VSKGASAIGDLAGIIGGPVATPSVVTPPSPPRTRRKAPQVKRTSVTFAEDIAQPKLLEDPDERSDRITAILPISLLSQVETRVAALRRKKKVSVSGYIEAALRELLATGERDIEALEKHRIKARRTVARLR
jgi:hypothetical protein